MTTYNESSAGGRDVGERVDVTLGVPTDRVRWGPILAGVFAALTALAVLSTLGTAIGLTAYDPGDRPRNYAIGAGIWGALSMLLAFGFGGWLTARSQAIRGSENGLLNGFLVAGVGIPVLLFVLGSAGALMANAETSNYRDPQARGNYDSAITASASIRGDGISMGNANGSANDQRDEARRAASRTAWGTLLALALAIGASAAAGFVGARDDYPHTRRSRSTASTSTSDRS